ncbi:MAG: hypothetical protein IID38_07200 [Planctomycetes bacterium]|nr:hypothetical protein [Planctomycetota bacterium]
MLKKLLQFSVENAWLVIMVAILALGLAVYEVPRMAMDVFPELNAPTVTIITATATFGIYSSKDFNTSFAAPSPN